MMHCCTAGVPARAAALVLAALVLAGCGEDADDAPYFRFAGGGFVFNYNLAEAYYGFVAERLRALPEGSVVEARFEDPAGGAPLVVRRPARAAQAEYAFRTPPLAGVRADRDYRVELRLLDPDGATVLAAYEHTFRSSLDQDVLPREPLTIGPGYQPNPDSAYARPRSGTGSR